MRRRRFLENTAITVGVYGGVLAAVGTATGGVAYVLEATDDFDGEYSIDELDRNMTALQGAEVAVEGYPSPQEPNHVMFDVEPGDYETTWGDFDLSDDDGWIDGDFWDDFDLLDTEWLMNLYESPEGGASVPIIDENHHLDDVVQGLDRGEISRRKVRIYGDVDRQDELYAIEVESAEQV